MTTDRIPTNWREEYLHVERSKQQLQKDMTVAFDRIAELKRSLDRAKLMLWIQCGVIVAGGSLIGSGPHIRSTQPGRVLTRRHHFPHSSAPPVLRQADIDRKP